jgi:pSer/pThr/pTyr-binding forkhead associated (FHA) protein
MLYFEVQTGKHKGKRLKLMDGEFVIGRDEDVTLRIASAEVSRRHCIIHVSGNSVKIEDLDSRNGTFVDGFPIKGTAPLTAGCLLTVGPMAFRLQDSNAKAPGAKATKKGDSSLSDDDIATWLAENDGGAVKSGDTTIIPGRVDAPASPIRAPIPPKKKREFKSVAEEAQDIIRRFHEMQDAAQQSGGSP